MRGQHLRVGLLGVLAASLLGVGVASADVTTERGGSILVFPKVIANGTRDTIIQITNVSNSLVRAHCFYVNASLLDPSRPEGVLNPRLWQEVDFDIMLTRQQPTHWVVSEGRRVNPFDPVCSRLQGRCSTGANAGDPCQVLDPEPACGAAVECAPITDCGNAGFDPGLIPPVVPDFEGELKCIEVDDGGAPLSGNHLKGEATIQNTDLFIVEQIGDENTAAVIFGTVSKYNGLAIIGTDNNGDGTLVLGGGQCVGDGALCRSDEDCADAGPCAIEYNGCPDTWIINHLADGAPNLVFEDADLGESIDFMGSSQVFTQLTIVPCTQNFETQEQTSVTLQFLTWDEFELQFSVSTTVTCWDNFFMSELGASALTFAGTLVPDPQGTMYLQTRVRSAGGTPRGVLMVAEEYHLAQPIDIGESPLPFDSARVGSTAAVNLHVEGEQAQPDVITVPAEQLAP